MKRGFITGILAAVTVLSVMAPAVTVEAAWQADTAGWWWTEESGYPVNDWRMIDGRWYWFDGTGYMATGWRVIDGSWYYLDGSGAMVHDCWVGNYYVGTSGAMFTDTYTPDGYYVGADGAWIPEYFDEGWKQSGSNWWYRYGDGSYAQNGWKQINGNWYYFDTAGWMLSDTWIGDYYVGTSGAMFTDAYTPDGYYVGTDGAWIPGYSHTHEFNIPITETKQTWVVDQAAWTETVNEPVYGMVEHTICNTCGADITSDPVGHGDASVDAYLAGESTFWCGGYHSKWVHQQTGTKTYTVDHPEEGHWETNTVVIGYQCSCGAVQ